MVDSVKQYGTAGVGSTVELGKQGPKIVSSSDNIELQDKDGARTPAKVAEGTSVAHAVTKGQFEEATQTRVQSISETVTFDGGNQFLFTVPANAKILSTMIEKTSGNWLNYDSNTDIIVGDVSDPDRLYSIGFIPDGGQYVDETNYVYASETDLYANVSQGGATTGSATIRIMLSGSEVDQTAP